MDCVEPSCSGHGSCLHGQCHCTSGWTGSNCETQLSLCPEHCSGHGTFQSETSTCICDVNWTGPDCSTGTTWFTDYVIGHVIIWNVVWLEIGTFIENNEHFKTVFISRFKLDLKMIFFGVCLRLLHPTVNNWIIIIGNGCGSVL